jgi:hypothetical protein
MAIFQFLFPAVFVVAGAGIVVWSIGHLISAFASPRWPATSGVVVVSYLQRSRFGDGMREYWPELSYRYTVQGSEFVAGRVRFGDHVSTGWSAPGVRIVEEYPVGKVVSVRYNPDDPGEAVLEPGVNALVLVEVASGLVLLLISLVVLWRKIEAGYE